MKSHFRTDLAIEEIGRIGDNEILGVKSSVEEHNHVKVEKTIIDEIHDERIQASRKLNKIKCNFIV